MRRQPSRLNHGNWMRRLLALVLIAAMPMSEMQWFDDAITNGVDVGFRGETCWVTGMRSNHPTTPAQKADITEWFVDQVDNGWMEGPFNPHEIPYHGRTLC